jgi:hypothetical protein
LGDIAEANVQLETPQATLTMLKHIPVMRLQEALSKAGEFTITEADNGMHHAAIKEENRTWFQTYKPILLIFGYLLVISIITTEPTDWMKKMQVFMGGFFLAFSFFKMLDLKGFAESYSTYDILARRLSGWGLVYAFIELFLGLAYVINFRPLITNLVTLIVMSVSIIGVLQTVFNKRKIQCACLGTVFNLPMSTVTIIEDALMIAMSAVMLIHYTF